MSSAPFAVPAMPQDLTNCPHERRPGTTVCLHCRHAERVAARAVRGRIFSHVMTGGAILGVVSVAVSAALAAFDGKPEVAAAIATPAPVTLASTASAGPAPVTLAATASGAPVPVTLVAMESGAHAPAPPPAAPGAALPVTAYRATSTATPAPSASARLAGPSLIPLVPEGLSPLADSMSVMRRGDTVVVHFDTELGRTRRPDKFDAIVRSTLAQIYGPHGETMLAPVTPGSLAQGGDLLADLPARGIRIPAGNGSTLAVWPVTRPGRDGPLVIGYRAIVTP